MILIIQIFMGIEPNNPRGDDLYLDYTHAEGTLCY